MPTVSAVQAEIEERLRRHTAALARHDTEAAMQLFASDAIMRPANVEPLRGITALREFFECASAAVTVGEGTFFTEELYLYDFLVFHFGTYEFTAPRARKEVVEKGGFVIVWRRQRDGSWLYHRGILNSSLQKG